MKKLIFFLIFIPLSMGLFGQKPTTAPPQVGTGLTSDVGKLLWMDANGRGTLSPLSTVLGQNMTWNVGGNSVSAASVFGTTTPQDIIFKTGNAQRMILTASGLLGINRTTADYYLDVNGQIRATGIVHGNNWNDGTSFLISNGATDYVRFKPTGVQFQSYLGINGETGTLVYPFLAGCNYSDVAGLYIAGFKKSSGAIAASVESTGNFYASGTGRFAGMGSGASTDSIVTADATNVLRKRRLADVLITVPKLTSENFFTNIQNFTDINMSGNFVTDGNVTATNGFFVGTAQAANATAGTHLMNRNSSDIRYAQLSTNNTFLSPVKFNSVTELSNVSASNQLPSVKISNGNAQSSSFYITNSIDVTTGSYTANGDISINPTTSEMAITQALKRKDFKFGTNTRQNIRIKNLVEVGGGSSQSFTVQNDAGIIKLYCSAGDVLDMASITMNVTLPASPQNDEEFKLICINAPATIAFTANTGQSILDTSSFSPSVASVLTAQFLSDTPNSTTGVWVIKKQ